jgi:hypothetical protein
MINDCRSVSFILFVLDFLNDTPIYAAFFNTWDFETPTTLAGSLSPYLF